MSEAGYPPIGQPVSKQRLYSCKLVSNRIYINSDPAMPYQLLHEWRVNELADEILRACAEYDITANWEQAKFLAVKIAKQLLKDKRQIDGGFELGWD